MTREKLRELIIAGERTGVKDIEDGEGWVFLQEDNTPNYGGLEWRVGDVKSMMGREFDDGDGGESYWMAGECFSAS